MVSKTEKKRVRTQLKKDLATYQKKLKYEQDMIKSLQATRRSYNPNVKTPGLPKAKKKSIQRKIDKEIKNRRDNISSAKWNIKILKEVIKKRYT